MTKTQTQKNPTKLYTNIPKQGYYIKVSYHTNVLRLPESFEGLLIEEDKNQKEILSSNFYILPLDRQPQLL